MHLLSFRDRPPMGVRLRILPNLCGPFPEGILCARSADSVASHFSLRDFRTASLDAGEHAHDERLDRAVLAVALSIVGAGMAFLLAMAFVFFPEWIRVTSFASDSGAPSPGAVLHRRIVAAANVQQSQTIARPRGRAFEGSPPIVPVGPGPAAVGNPTPDGRSRAANPGSPSRGHSSERARSAAAENGRSPGRKA